MNSDKEIAIKYFLKSLRLDSHHVNTYYNLGILNLEKNSSIAKKYFSKVLTMDKVNSRAIKFLNKIKEKEELIKQLNSYIQKAEYYNKLAFKYVDKSNSIAAEYCFLHAIELDSAYIESYNNLGVLYSKNNNKIKANFFF